MAVPATQPNAKFILEDVYFINYLKTMIQQIVKNELDSNIDIERRFNTLETGHTLLLESVRTLETNTIIYREDTLNFMTTIHKENENFRQEITKKFERLENKFERLENKFDQFRKEIKESNDQFRKEIKESNDQFRKEVNAKFDAIDKKFDAIDSKFDLVEDRFDFINKQFIEVHKAINRMTIFFISGLGTIVLLSKIIDKIWP